MFTTSRSVLRVVAALALTFAVSRAAEAGPPLICHPFDAGASPVLPWNTSAGWRTPDRKYDVQQLTTDTLRLLTAEAPILARMENMRRATIYAGQDTRVASELLAAVLSRTATAAHDPLAWFDAGYLIESYRQASAIFRTDMLAGVDRDGYSFLQKAIAKAGSSPEMEFAASLMKEGAASTEHRRRALAGAAPGSAARKEPVTVTGVRSQGSGARAVSGFASTPRAAP